MDQQFSNNTRESEATLLEGVKILSSLFNLTGFEALSYIVKSHLKA